jgi:ribonucleoside-diphosphate reductase beta chain
MQKDKKDWLALTKEEKNVVEQILMNFAQMETNIGDYWSSMIPKWFPKPEIKALGQLFGSVETTHAYAYSYLNEILGLNDFEAFLYDEDIMNKLDMLIEPKEETLENKAISLAVFSAIAEGTLLYSSFATLLSFKRRNMLNGISQQMVYSILDESLHSKVGCELFRILCSENSGLKNKVRDTVFQAFKDALNAEFKCINKIFELGDIETISQHDLKNFIIWKANSKWNELGYEGYITKLDWDVNKFNWFFEEIQERDDDFFHGRVTKYKRVDDTFVNDIFKMVDNE